MGAVEHSPTRNEQIKADSQEGSGKRTSQVVGGLSRPPPAPYFLCALLIICRMYRVSFAVFN